MTHFPLTFKMESDWQVSTGGTRQGRLDSVIKRDVDGLPCIPFTTVRGIWRDSAEQLAATLAGCWPKLVPQLFGSEPAKEAGNVEDVRALGDRRGDSRLTCGDARLPSDLRDLLRGTKRQALRHALTFVKPGVKIEEVTMQAQDDHLRFDEVARRDLQLECVAEFTCEGIGPIEGELCLNFLQASFLLIRHIGGNRRRGFGLCATTISNGSKLLDLLKKLDGKNAPTINALKRPDNLALNNTSQPQSAQVWAHYKLLVKINSPTVIPKAIQGNVVESHDTIPGTFLIGAVTKMFGPDATTVMAQIASGEIVIEPAYPSIDGLRGQPVPFIWQQKKDATGGPNGKGVIELEPRFTSEARDKNDVALRKSMGERFSAVQQDADTACIAFAKAKLEVQTRNTIQDDTQRPAGPGGVFTYEYIAPNQDLIAIVHVPTRTPIRTRQIDARLGRAKNTGYGAVSLELFEMPARAEVDFQAGAVKICLTTPLILPHSGGLLSSNIKSALGLKTSEVDIKNSMLRLDRVDGWSAAWNLPKPSLNVLVAGSVIAVELGASDVDILNKALVLGAGQRQGEGYGRFVPLTGELLSPPQTQWVIEINNSNHLDANISATTLELLKPIQSIAIKEKIRKHAEALGEVQENRENYLGWTKKVTPSQCGSLRSIMGAYDNDERVQAVQAFLSQSGGKRDWVNTALKCLFSDDGLKRLFNKADFAELILPAENGVLDQAEYQRYARLAFVQAAMKSHINSNPESNNGTKATGTA